MSFFENAWEKEQFTKLWIKYCLAGSILAYLISITFGEFLGPSLLGCVLGLFVMVFTNFGWGYWSKAGWSDSQRQPWNIPPIHRPRLGGFFTGLGVISFLTVYFPLFALVWLDLQ